MFADDMQRPTNRLDFAPLSPTKKEEVVRPANLLDIAVPPPNRRASLALERLFGPKRQVISFKPKESRSFDTLETLMQHFHIDFVFLLVLET